VDSKNAIRRSLRASTFDGMFATIFSNVTGGVLLSNFLVELDATPTQIGLLASIPMLANFMQPLGAFLGDRTTSRHFYCLWIYGPSRLLWLILAAGIALAQWHRAAPERLVIWTLAIVSMTHFFGALGSASWLSWLAVLVPRRLRGRYFGIRNSAASLTNLLSVPVLGWLVATYPGGFIQGYGLLVVVGVIAGLISLGFQYRMVDVNPQLQEQGTSERGTAMEAGSASRSPGPDYSFLQDTNFLSFLLYFSLWMFAVNLSAPFFNLYMLDNLAIDVRWVTIYNSVQSGANMLMLVFWGKLADRVGNRIILITVGILVAATPLFWLATGSNSVSLWFWLPLLHVLAGVTWAAIDLCNNNLQLGVAPVRHQATYFAVAAAVAGVSGALGTTAGGFLAEFADYGGIPGLFALSAAVRLVALLPLVFVHEQRGQSLRQMMRLLFPAREVPVLVEAPSPVRIDSELADPSQYEHESGRLPPH
jgi:MFS family permease